MRKRLITWWALLALAFGTILVVPANAADIVESEDNGTTAKADVVSVGQTISAQTQGTYSDDDYFAINVSTAGRAKFNLTFPVGLGTGDAYYVEMLNSQGKQLFEFDLSGGDSSGIRLASQATYVPAGRLYVHVRGYARDATWGKTYKLNVGVTPGRVESEFNDDSASATPLILGVATSGSCLNGSGWRDVNYYRATLPKSGRMKIGFTFPDNLGAGDGYFVSVLDASGDELYEFDVSASRWSGSWLANMGTYMPAGDVYIRVHGYDYDATWGKPYRLTLSSVDLRAETEINDETATADTLPAYSWVHGSALNASSWRDQDYYAINLKSRKQVALKLRFPSGLGSSAAYSLTVLNKNGVEVASYDLDGSDYAKTIKLTLPAGKSYLRVTGYDYNRTWGKSYELLLAGTFKSTPAPKVTGSARVGSTLTASVPRWSPTATKYTYQWYRSGKAISGATSSKYRLTSADRGKTIKVKVSGYRSYYAKTSVYSSSTKKVA